MKLRIINLADGYVNVHAADCADCKKDEQIATRQGGMFYTLDAPTKLAVAANFWEDQINEGSTDAESCICEFTWKPCCGKLPTR